MSSTVLIINICCTLIGSIAFGLDLEVTTDSKLDVNQNCHSTFPGTLGMLSTLSPYIPPPDTALIDPPHLKGCKAEQIWLTVRHGTRTMGPKVIEQMKTVLLKLQDDIIAASSIELCEETLADIAAWKMHPGFEEESLALYLVPQGTTDMIDLATRYKKRFPSLFGHKYDNSTYKFRFSATERAEASAKAFVGGLFREEGEKNVYYPEAVEGDPLLRFYKNCTRWLQDVRYNPAGPKESKLFAESEYYKTMLQNVQQRLGLKQNMTVEKIQLLHYTCAIESAWNTKKLSPWCGVFDKSDLKLTEYKEDLSSYWIHGYGLDINFEQACAPVRNLIDGFQSRIDDPENTPKVIVYFSHSGELLKLFCRLELFKDDEKLRSDNYLTMGDRKWRTSQIDKFATNIAFILHKCQDDFVISALFQEMPIKLPQCNDWYCKFSDYKSKMSDIVDNCDKTFASVCKI